MRESIPLEAIPRICEGLDIMNLSISSEEGFLLSRIDGVSSVEMLVSSSGLGSQKTLEILKALSRKDIVILHTDKKNKPPACQATKSEAPAIYDYQDIKTILRKKLPTGDELIPIIDSIFVNLENLSYYDLLNVGRKASAAEIKKAYLKKTKIFHPDRFYRKADLEFRKKLQEIFKQLNKGLKLLADPEAKKEYDASLEQEEEFEAEAEEEIIAPAKGRSRTVKGEASPFRKRLQKEVVEKTREPVVVRDKKTGLSAGTKLKLGLKDNRPQTSPIIRKIEKMKGGELKSKTDQAERFYNGAMQERNKGNFNGARINLKLAIQYDPHNKKYAKALADMDSHEEEKKAEFEYKAGRDAQREGDLATALRYYKEAARLGFQDPDLFHHMAELFMELEANYDKARALSIKAIDMKAGVPEYHMTLARAYKGLDQKPAAVVQLEKVVALDPKNKIAAKEIKALKRR